MKNYSISEKIITIAFFALSVAMVLCAGAAIVSTLF